MNPAEPTAAGRAATANGADRDRMEVIRFRSQEHCVQAIGALIDAGMLNFTSYSEEEWIVRTPVARKLRERGVPFDWLTEHV